MCEALGLVKMDFLGLRNLTCSTTRSRTSRRNRDVDLVLEDLAFDDPATYDAAGPRRHARRLPARRRADAGAAAAACSPTTSRTSPPSARSTGPVRWAPTATPSTPAARTAAQAIDPIHPELAEPLEPDAGRDLRPDRLPGAGHGDRPGARRATRSDRPTTCAARWARRRRRSSTSEYAGFQAGMLERGYSAAARSRRCGTSCCRSPTTPSTRRTPRRTASSPTGPPTSRPTTRPSTWRRCSPPSRTTRTSRRSTSTSAAGWASRCCRPTSTSRRPTSPRSAPTSASASPRSATSATTSWPASSRRATRERPLRRLQRLPRQGAARRSATSGSSSR